ncbi:hypothetical protein E2C01_054302 [Portunus trituberculatus]|uniref:Uncharacterized protein n=1 Tax=Portunus trituberculatus TaxID=210409 RepID=A0A5B7GRN0_PORTR|nr:hypothetical protein [Portunus trituberculatus]
MEVQKWRLGKVEVQKLEMMEIQKWRYRSGGVRGWKGGSKDVMRMVTAALVLTPASCGGSEASRNWTWGG